MNVPAKAIERLAVAQYGQVRPLFAAQDGHLVIDSILRGVTPAPIYVDDSQSPTAALTWFRHRYFVAGDAANGPFRAALGGLLAGEVFPQARAAGNALFMCFASPAWIEALSGVLEPWQPARRARRSYEGTALRFPHWRTLLPEGFTVRLVDAALLAEDHLAGLDALVEEMLSERESVEAFLAHSFGVVALRGDALAGWCLSEYNNATRCEIGIATLPPYRRQGLAVALTSALIEYARAQGVQRIGWHCWADNRGSVATAEKLGLALKDEHDVLLGFFDRD